MKEKGWVWYLSLFNYELAVHWNARWCNTEQILVSFI